jgi:uncharacterized RDD family membrane protein YckC
MATPVNDKYKTFVQRLFAAIIDALVFLPFIIFEQVVPVTEDKWLYIGYNLTNTICWTLYCVIGVGKYGQTIGKKQMKIKVLSLNEKKLIGYKRAFLREAVWFFVSIGGIVWLYFTTSDTAPFRDELIGKNNMFIISSIWLTVELVTMFFNTKRRAVHDFMGGSVVIDLNKVEKENLDRAIAT